MDTRTRTYTTPTLCDLAGVTYRQGDHWSRLGYLRPLVAANGSGSQRLFDLREVEIAWALGQLSTGPGGRVPNPDPLRALRSFTGLVICTGRTLTVVDISEFLGVLAVEPVVTVLNLDACPVDREDTP